MGKIFEAEMAVKDWNCYSIKNLYKSIEKSKTCAKYVSSQNLALPKAKNMENF